jgi:hypothetical protein
MNGGLCIQILSPSPGQRLVAGSDLAVQVLVTLACGCPPGVGGSFDFRRFQLKGSLEHADGTAAAFSLAPRSAGIFVGRLQVGGSGLWRIAIEAFDPESGRIGRAGVDLKVGK